MQDIWYTTHKIASDLYRAVTRHIFAFCVVCISIFFLMFTLFGVLGFLPKNMQQSLQPRPLYIASVATTVSTNGVATVANVASVSTSANRVVDNGKVNKTEKPPVTYTESGIKELPLRIIFPTLHRDVTVYNPESTNNASLDSFLLKGVVRYPTSAKLNDEGNIFLLGHSSYLKIVRNKAYQAFNDIQKLQPGDQIILIGTERQYVYEVQSVRLAKNTDVSIDLSQTGHKLTLVTCNSFGAKEDRYVVAADFVESAAI